MVLASKIMVWEQWVAGVNPAAPAISKTATLFNRDKDYDRTHLQPRKNCNAVRQG